MEIISVFAEAGKKVALFLDTNGEYLGVDYVINTAPTAPEGVTTNLSKPGFKVSETPFGPLEVIEEHTIFFVNYEKESTDQLEIKLNDVPQTVQMNDVVKLENETAVLWLENGLPIWYGTEYSFTALSNRTITTKEGDEPTTALVSSIQHLNLRDNEGVLSHLGQVYVPEGRELIEVGYLLHTNNNLELTMDTEGVTVLRSDSVNEFRNEFLRTVTEDKKMNTNVRAYAVIDNGEVVLQQQLTTFFFDISRIPEGYRNDVYNLRLDYHVTGTSGNQRLNFNKIGNTNIYKAVIKNTSHDGNIAGFEMFFDQTGSGNDKQSNWISKPLLEGSINEVFFVDQWFGERWSMTQNLTTAVELSFDGGYVNDWSPEAWNLRFIVSYDFGEARFEGPISGDNTYKVTVVDEIIKMGLVMEFDQGEGTVKKSRSITRGGHIIKFSEWDGDLFTPIFSS